MRILERLPCSRLFLDPFVKISDIRGTPSQPLASKLQLNHKIYVGFYPLTTIDVSRRNRYMDAQLFGEEWAACPKTAEQ